MTRFNTIGKRTVPIFLVACAGLLAGACGLSDSEDADSPLDAEELYFVEQYLRVVEARQEAVLGDSLAEGRFAFLAEELPADSLRAIARRLSRDAPERWQPIFEEIVRRKKIMEAEGRKD